MPPSLQPVLQYSLEDDYELSKKHCPESGSIPDKASPLYDFSKGRRNPYAARLKRRVTIRQDERTIACFKGISRETGNPYQTFINLYLRECAASGKQLSSNWKSVA